MRILEHFQKNCSHAAVELKRAVLAIAILIGLCAQAPAETVPLYKLDNAAQAERITSDLKTVVVYRAGLSNATAFAAKQTNLFPTTAAQSTVTKAQLPRREEKELLW